MTDRELHYDEDDTGRTVACWYTDENGDRVDVHPRWWDQPFVQTYPVPEAKEDDQ